MDGSAQDLHWFSSNDIEMEVPFFQRPYVWKEEDWESLLDSIKTSPKDRMPFIGSIILQQNGDKYLIIDGQQRLTTLSVMIKAFLDVYGSKELSPDIIAEIKSFIYGRERVELKFIYHPRLVPSHVDSDIFETIMQDLIFDEDHARSDELIKSAYFYFKDYFSKCSDGENSDFAFKILSTKKFFIAIILDSKEDDEQKIFDSTNSLGKGLTKADLIKNYLFSRLKEAGQEEHISLNDILKLHQKYWLDVFYDDDNFNRCFWEEEKTIGRFKTDNMEIFLKNFASIIGIYSPSETGGLDGLYKSYKERINSISNYTGLEDFLRKLASYAECFYKFHQDYLAVTDFTIDDVVNSTLLLLDKTQTTTFDSFVLKVLKERPTDYLDQLAALRKFIFKRLLWGGKTKNYNNVNTNLLKSSDPINYLETYEDVPPLPTTASFPTGLLNLNNKPATLILFFDEMIKRKNSGGGFELGLQYQFTLEHIMPQNWSRNWLTVPCFKDEKDAQGNYIQVTTAPEINTIRRQCIYEIGNMTLLTSKLNSSIGNGDALTKLNGKNGKPGVKKLTGSLLVTKEVVDIIEKQQGWNEKDVYARNQSIFDDLNGYFHF